MHVAKPTLTELAAIAGDSIIGPNQKLGPEPDSFGADCWWECQQDYLYLYYKWHGEDITKEYGHVSYIRQNGQWAITITESPRRGTMFNLYNNPYDAAIALLFQLADEHGDEGTACHALMYIAITNPRRTSNSSDSDQNPCGDR
jgi:hypothetical protein